MGYMSRIRAIKKRDLLNTGIVFVLGLASWILPETTWPTVAKAVARSIARVKTTHFARRGDKIPLPLVEAIADNPRDANIKFQAAKYWDWMETLASYRPWGWSPKIDLRGTEYLDKSLAAGNGAILWVSYFAGSFVAAKIALHRAGYALTHLSRIDHGFSRTPFGIRYLNPIQVRTENRYLKDRIVIERDGREASFQALQRCLQNNGVLSITVADTAQRTLEVPFMRGLIRLATGPAYLAKTANAGLHPVFAIRTTPGQFSVTIEPPITAIDGANQEQEFWSVLSDYAKLLESYVSRYPDQWLGWDSARVREA